VSDRRQTREPEGYVGNQQHGDPTRGGPRDRRLISSGVWGGGAVAVNSEHGEDAWWDPCRTGEDASCCPCCWYAYAASVGLSGCVHPGMDINTSHGTALVSPVDGKIEFCGFGEFYQPMHVDILDDQGRYHILGHMSSVSQDLAVGNRVRAGEYVGNSGTPPGAGAHLHYELREGGFTGNAVTPEPVLVNFRGGNGQDGQFERRDRIKVVDGPVRLRKGAGIDSAVLTELGTGTELCVLGGPEEATGFVWYRVRVGLHDDGQDGWVAGRFCARVEKKGCGGHE
jgi:hypothetical protein